jgi:hypothetical protein
MKKYKFPGFIFSENGEWLFMIPKELLSRIRGLSSLIGNTPLLAIDYTFKGENRTIFAKAEHLNMTGSIKDRMAFHILLQGYKRGILKSGDHKRQHRNRLCGNRSSFRSSRNYLHAGLDECGKNQSHKGFGCPDQVGEQG